MKRALICGVSGQDGALLARFLLSKGYDVLGASRDHRTTNFTRLAKLGVLADLKLCSMSVTDFRSTFNVIKNYKPDEIYNLAGQTSVSMSFDQPSEAMDSIVQATLTLLEVIRMVGYSPKLYFAGSSEMFGEIGRQSATETTALSPKSPYAVAKSSAYWLAKSYRDSYEIFAANGILFNHESELRSEQFVTRKIVSAAVRISRGYTGELVLGDVGISRDWGWAEEYVEAMWLMLQDNHPDDYVVATGRSESLIYFLRGCFDFFNLNWRDYVRIDKNMSRPNELRFSCGDSSKIATNLGWRAETDVDCVIERLCIAAEREFDRIGTITDSCV